MARICHDVSVIVVHVALWGGWTRGTNTNIAKSRSSVNQLESIVSGLLYECLSYVTALAFSEKMSKDFRSLQSSSQPPSSTVLRLLKNL